MNNKKNGYEYVQWGYDLVSNAYLNKEKKKEENYQDTLYNLYLMPFSNEIYGPTNPILFFGGNSFMDLSDKKMVTLRDGLIPLTLFFKETAPEKIAGDIYIHKDLWFIVPPLWQKKIKFFSLQAQGIYDKENLPQKIFVSGILNSILADPEELEDRLKYLSDTIGKKNLEKIEVMAYFPDKRNDLWGAWDEENVLKYSKAIFQNLKMDIQVPEWRTLHNEVDYRNCLYYEINNGLFVKDSYLEHFVLSRGGGSLRVKENKVDKHFTQKSKIPLSIYHSIEVFDLNYEAVNEYEDPFNKNYFPYFKKMIEASNNPYKKLNFHWEKWMATYLKNVYKNEKSQF